MFLKAKNISTTKPQTSTYYVCTQEMETLQQ